MGCLISINKTNVLIIIVMIVFSRRDLKERKLYTIQENEIYIFDWKKEGRRFEEKAKYY